MDLPRLTGITSVPLVLADGSLLTTPGYDSSSGYYYAPPEGFTLPDVPEQPTAQQLSGAVSLLAEPFADFPFVDDASRAAACALLFSVLARPVIDGPTPLLVVESPMPGTGKGLLVDAVAVLALGSKVRLTPKPESDDEWRKKLLSILANGPRLVAFDNVRGTLRSQALESLLTSTAWGDRTLGRSEHATYPNATAWAATSNNATLGSDMRRRCYLVRLDARTERPEERTGWRHPDLLAWIRENRPELVAAALTVTRAWVAAGRPGPSSVVPTLGSFESWRHVVGGLLEVAGVRGFLGNLDAVREHTADDGGWADFAASWWGRFADEWVTAADLVHAQHRGELCDAPGGLDLARVNAAQVLGKALQYRRDAYLAGFRVEREEGDGARRRRGGARWRLAPSPTANVVPLPTVGEPDCLLVASGAL